MPFRDAEKRKEYHRRYMRKRRASSAGEDVRPSTKPEVIRGERKEGKVIKVSDTLYSKLADIAKREHTTIGAALERRFEEVTQTSKEGVIPKKAELTENGIKEIADSEIKEFMNKFPFCSSCGYLLFPDGDIREITSAGTIKSPFRCWRCRRIERDITQ